MPVIDTKSTFAFLTGFAFANERSAAEFDEQRSTFFRANERYDHYLEIREGLDLVGVNFQEYMIAVGDSHHNPWYNNQLAFWLFSVALLSWPMRVLLEYNTAYVNFQVGSKNGPPRLSLIEITHFSPSSSQMVKLFGSNYGGGESPCHISRVSTLDSLSNCMIAPSYSEAMLAERIYCLRSCSNSLDDHRPSEQPKNGRKCSGTRVSLRIGQVLPYQVGTVSLEEEANVSSMRRALVDRQENLPELLGEAQDEQESGTATKNCQLPEPPSYEEVIEDQRRVLATEMAPRLSLKTYWNHLIGLFRSNLDQTGLPRSFTDKDLFQKILAAQLKRKPCTSSSYGDISSNLIANV